MKYFKFLEDPARLLWLGFILSFILHIIFINEPPKSQHLWRQSNTLAVARNFYQEEMNIFNPRVDNRYTTDGITGSQFPSYEFILAGIYHLTGEEYYVQRLYALVWHFIGYIGIYYLFSLISSSKRKGAFAAWTYLWCPVLFYYAITALPDNLALPLSVWGTYFTLLAVRNLIAMPKLKLNTCLYLTLGGIFLIIAGATKIQYLSIGAVIFGYLLYHWKNVTPRTWVLLGLFGFIVCFISILWYIYAIDLIKKSGLKDFGLETSAITKFSVIIEIVLKTLVSAIPESILSYPTTVVVLVAIFFLVKRWSVFKNSQWLLGFAMYTVLLIIFVFLNLERIDVHDYYMSPLIPCFLALALIGFGYLENKLMYLGIVLIAQPIFCGIRMIPSRFMGHNEVREEFYNEKTRKKLVSLVPHDALCIVGPDVSRCIYLYALEKKGYTYSDSCELVDKIYDEPVIEPFIEKGYTYFYCNDSLLAQHRNIKDYLQLKTKVDGFWVYELKKRSLN